MLLVGTTGTFLNSLMMITATKPGFDDDVEYLEHICILHCFSAIGGHSKSREIGQEHMSAIASVHVSWCNSLNVHLYAGRSSKCKHTSVYLCVTPWRTGNPFTS